VLTDAAFADMVELGTYLARGTESVIERHGVPWSVGQVGARAEYRFADPAPRNGGESHAAGDAELDDYLHVYAANRGILLTPFHNMALVCPATTREDVDAHLEVLDAAVAELV
jgi:glutamate-1-semialdehyde 2,1-aminomutase